MFSGGGGASEGLRQAFPEAEATGYEVDLDAILVARAAGHMVIQADVTQVDPRTLVRPDLLHASPTCRGFSTAGHGRGRQDFELLLSAVEAAGEAPGRTFGLVRRVREEANDRHSALTLEPLLWIAETGLPRFVTMEQTPTVLPVWEAYASTLRRWGYQVWTGNLHAEAYGVPQARRRAFLMARLGGAEVTPPPPTHSRYHPRTPEKMDPGVLPWVSMAEAMGWVGDRPTHLGDQSRSRGTVRPVDSPAPTLTASMDNHGFRWVRREVAGRINDQSGTPYDPEWPARRPSTTVAGRGLVQNPGATANRYNGSTKSRNDGLRISPVEAGVLQGFRPDYPWSAARTMSAQFHIVGNAVPPPLMAAVAHHLVTS